MPRPVTHLSLTVEEHLFDSFCLLTGSGFRTNVRPGCTVRHLLCEQLGIAPQYVTGRIQIVFLNGVAIDDPDTAIVPADSTIVLSAAMPGLAGAMFRKGSPYAPMRSQLSSDDSNEPLPAAGESCVSIRLLNMLQKEIGSQLLDRGIHIPGRPFHQLLTRSKKALRCGIIKAEMNGSPIQADLLFNIDWSGRELFLAARPHVDSRQHG